MKMTFNRRLILAVLAEEQEGPPPHGAATVEHALSCAFSYKWQYEPYVSMVTLPTKRQIYRTLADLVVGGLIVGTRVKCEASMGGLPYWETLYQLASEVDKNALLAECTEVYRVVNKAVNGFNFFGAVMDMGLPTNEVAPLLLRVKSLMQRTHPDKATGYEAQFLQMKQCADLIKQGIPLPIPTHEQRN